jgi:CubicO group peptidase (beta-lactamase class C family)
MVHTQPEAVGLSSARLARIGAAIRRRIERREIAGAIAVVARRGRIAHLECHGLMDVEAARPMAPDTILRMYSMTKPVTAVAALTLHEEGWFELDDPASAFLPELGGLKVLKSMGERGPELEGLARPVSIRHLFTHTSGICYPNPEGSPAEKLLALEAGNLGNAEEHPSEELVKWMARAPLAHQPGAGWTYGFSTDVLGRLVEVVSGKPLDAFLEERLFSPLGMRDTAFFVPEEKHARLAKVYGPDKEGKLAPVPWSNAAFHAKPRFLSGGGGLVSTAGDYLRFALMLQGGGELDGERVLGRRSVRLMMSGHIPQLAELPAVKQGTAFGPGHTFGLGGRVLVDEAIGLRGSAGTYGWDGMASTTFWVDPREELVGMLLPQAIPGPANLHEQFRTLVYQALVQA